MSYFQKFVEFSKAMFTILPKIICPCSNKSLIRWKKSAKREHWNRDLSLNKNNAIAIDLCQFSAFMENDLNLDNHRFSGAPRGRVLQPPHKFENFVVATSTLAQVGGSAQKTLLVKFRKNWSMFRGCTVTSKFWQFQKKDVFFILNVLDFKSNLWSLLMISTVFGVVV